MFCGSGKYQFRTGVLDFMQSRKKMIINLKVHKVLWVLIAGLSLIAAGVGLFHPAIYSKVLSSELVPTILAQDAMTLVVALVILILGLSARQTDIKKQMVVISLLAYLFYGYGIYVIEQFYNALYMLYMAIFALAFWLIVFGLSHMDQSLLRQIKASNKVRYISAGSLIFVALLFYSLWISQLLPLIQTGQKIEALYSIYILDMVFVLPALVISAVFLIRGKVLGLIFAPILFIKAFTLLFSVGLGGVFLLLYGQTADLGESAFYFILSAAFLALAVYCFKKIHFQRT
jgi:hypothetical protein